jgi:hypothetical protein
MRSAAARAFLRVLAGLASVTLAGTSAHAADEGVEVKVRDCRKLRVSEVKRLFFIEIADFLVGQPHQEPLRVLVRCLSDRIHIQIHEPVTKKKFERFIPPVRPNRPGRERIIALAASQLFIATWLELFPPPSTWKRKKEPERPPEKPSKPEPEPLLVPTVTAKAEPSRWFVSAQAGVSMRHLDKPLVLYGAAVRLGFSPLPDWRFHLEASCEAGRAERRVGRVDALMTGVGLGATRTFLRSESFSFDVTVDLAVRYARLSGEPTVESIVGDVSDGVVLEAGLALGPGLHVGGVRLGLNLEAGWAYPDVTGLVEGEPSVHLSGAWASISVGAELVF